MVEEAKDTQSQEFAKKRTKVSEVIVGISSSYCMDTAFDYFLYPYVIYKLGLLKGGCVMTALACVINIVSIYFYDWSKRDWFGFEAIKSFQDYRGGNRLKIFTAWLLRKNNIVVMILLSIKEDAFKTVVYMRHGKYEYNGLTARDWKIFITSLIIGNVYWTLAAYTGLSLFEWGYEYLNQGAQFWQ
jgi:hypothetical protein